MRKLQPNHYFTLFLSCLAGWAFGCGEPSQTFVIVPGGAGGVPDAGGSAGQLGGSAGTGSGGSNGGSSGGIPSAAGGASDGGGAGAGASAGAAGSAGTGGSTTAGDCGDRLAPIGWASVNQEGQNGTTGGGNGEVVDVTNSADFSSAVAGTTPRTVRVSGEVGEGARVEVGSHKSIIGMPGAVFFGRLSIGDEVNVIVQDLTIRGHDCEGQINSAGCSSDDAITVQNSHHLWFDHLHVYDGSDGNLDITNGANFITVSWTKFWYSRNNRPHRFSNLIAAADMVPEDVGRLKVTWHHNWWAENVDQRMPRTRRGLIHVFNNLFTASGNSYCTNSGFEATLLVENNIYRNVNDPHEPSDGGNMLAVGNVYEGTNNMGTDTGVGFDPDYDYELDATDGLDQRIVDCVGPR